MNATATKGVWEKHLTNETTLIIDENADMIRFVDKRENRSNITIRLGKGVMIKDITRAERTILKAIKRKAAKETA